MELEEKLASLGEISATIHATDIHWMSPLCLNYSIELSLFYHEVHLSSDWNTSVG